MKYYVTTQGDYLGGFSDELDPPADSTEVSTAPEYADQIWDFENGIWLAHVPCSIEEICPIIAGGLLKLKHGLSRTPNTINFNLICQEAELGYSAGQIVLAKVGALSGKGGIGPAMAISADSDYIYIRFCSASPSFNICRWDTGAQQDLCNTKWMIKFYTS